MIPISAIGSYVVPVVILLIVLCGVVKGQNVFDQFISGAKEGITTSVNILPALIALMMAIAMFKASGAFDLIVKAVAPLCRLLHFPGEIVPLAIMRPISGSGSLSILEFLLKTYGPDSTIGRIASVMQGSTETTFYTIAIYFGSVNIVKTRHTVPAALLSEFTGFVMSIIAVRLFF